MDNPYHRFHILHNRCYHSPSPLIITPINSMFALPIDGDLYVFYPPTNQIQLENTTANLHLLRLSGAPETTISFGLLRSRQMVNDSGSGNSGKQIAGALITPKDEVFDYDLDEFSVSANLEGNAASSSISTTKLHLLGMGFPPALVHRAIDEKGEDNSDLLLETILGYSVSSFLPYASLC